MGWTEADNVKLAELFRRGPRNGGIDPRNLSKNYIENEVIAKHWPGRKYKGFRQTYLPKARAWCVNQTITGTRAARAGAPAPAADTPAATAAASNNDEEAEEEKDDGTDADPAPAPAPAAEDTNPQGGEEDIDETSAQFNSMSLNNMDSGNTSLSFSYPYLMYHFIGDDNYQFLMLDFYVPGMAKRNFRPFVKAGGKTFQLSQRIPRIFTDSERLERVHHDCPGFNIAHQFTAFNETAAKITDKLAVGEQLYSTPQEIKLPITVEEEILTWSLDAFDNEDENFADEMAGEDFAEGGRYEDIVPPLQKYFMLSITLRGKKIRKANYEGTTRVFASPNRRRHRRRQQDGDDEMDDGDGDGGGEH